MATMLDYMLQTDAAIQKNRGLELANQNQQQQNQYYPATQEADLSQMGAVTQGQNLTNQKQQYVNNFIEKYPLLGISSSLPAGFAGQTMIADILKDVNPEMAAQVDRNNQLQLENQESATAARDAYAASAGFRALPSQAKEQAVNLMQNLGYPASAIASLVTSGDWSNVVNNNIPYSTYASNQTQPGVLAATMNPAPQPQGVPAAPPVNPGVLSQAIQNNVDVAKKEADLTQSKLIKGTTTTNIANQRAYNEIAGAIYNDTNQYIPSVQKYATYEGGFDRLLSRVQSGTEGGSSQDYINLLKFKQNAIALANETRRQLGGQATDAETKLMEEFVSGEVWKETPEQVFQKWQNLGNLINITGKSLKNSMAQTEAGLGTYASVPSSAESITQNKASVRAGYVAMTNPQGQPMQVPEGRAADAEKAGWKRG